VSDTSWVVYGMLAIVMFLPLIMDTLEYRIGNGGRMRQKCSNDDIVEHDQGSSEECSYCAEYLNGVADGKAAGKREGIEAAAKYIETHSAQVQLAPANAVDGIRALLQTEARAETGKR
jgi:hypothetical protein